MGWRNTRAGYGATMKILHWSVVAAFAFQFAAAAVMVRLGEGERFAGITQANAYNWHKSIGLVALGLALLRLAVRRLDRLPEWAPGLSVRERRLVHGYERALYAMMILMPVAGYLYVMAGGYGVHLFEAVHLANPIGKLEWLAVVAKWAHIAGGWVIVVALAAHVGLVLTHQLVKRDGLLLRMLPARRVRSR